MKWKTLALVLTIAVAAPCAAAEKPAAQPDTPALVKAKKISQAELITALKTAPAGVRYRVFDVIRHDPATWADVVLYLLEDRGKMDALSLVPAMVKSKAIDLEKLRLRAEELYASPYGFLRRRAAEAMFYADPKKGEEWLRAEHALYKTWQTTEGIMCTGQMSGFTGTVKRLLEPEVPVDPYETKGDPVVLPAKTFDIRVCPVPFAEKHTFHIYFFNNTGRDFVRYPNYRYSADLLVRPEKPEGGAPVGEFGVRGGHSLSSHGDDPRTVKQGGDAFDMQVRVKEDHLPRLEKVSVELKFTMPEGRAGTYAAEVPGKLFTPAADDTATLVDGLLSGEGSRRFTSLWIIDPQYHLKQEWKKTLDSASRRRIVDALLTLAERSDAPDAVTDEPFAYFPGPRGRSATVDALYRAIQSLETFPKTVSAEDVARLIGLKSHGALRVLERSTDHRLRPKAIMMVLDSREPHVIRNVSCLLRSGWAGPKEDLRTIEAAAARWLASDDPLTRGAGIHLGVQMKSSIKPAGLREASLAALESDDDLLLCTGMVACADMKYLTDISRFPAWVDDENPEVRRAAAYSLGILLENNAVRPDPAGKKALLEKILDFWESHDWRTQDEFSGTFLRLLDAKDLALVYRVWKVTHSWSLMDFLVKHRYDFGSSVIRTLYDREPMAALVLDNPAPLVKMEEERLALKGPPPPGEHYRAMLAEGIRRGDGSAGYACVPLAFETDPKSLDLLELAGGSESDTAITLAAWAVYCRDKARGTPLLHRVTRELDSPRVNRSVRERHGKMMEKEGLPDAKTDKAAGDSKEKTGVKVAPPRDPILWSYDMVRPGEEPPTVLPDGTLYTVAGSEAALVALDPAGKELWRYAGHRCQRVLHVDADGNPYVRSGDTVLAVRRGGTLAWSYHVDDVLRGIGVAPDGTVYVSGNQGDLRLLEADGTVRWEKKRYLTHHCAAPPLVDKKGNCYVITSDVDLCSLTPQGKERWRHKLSSPLLWGLTITPDDNICFHMAGVRITLNMAGAEVDRHGSQWHTVFYIDNEGRHYGSYSNRIQCWNRGKKVLWKKTVPDDEDGRLLACIGSGKHIYCTTHDGTVYCLDLDGAVRWKYETPFHPPGACRAGRTERSICRERTGSCTR